MTNDESDSPPPTLLDAEARGGETAEIGFGFQEAVTVAHVPDWLAYDGFTSLIREAMSDTEVRFFTPGIGMRVDALEAKGKQLPPSEFWDEIDHFKELDEGSPGTFQWFTLATAGLSRQLLPLANGLRRVRDPLGFYEPDSGVSVHSFAKYTKIVDSLGRPEDDAHFLFERVLLKHEYTADTDGGATFVQSLQSRSPEFLQYPAHHSRDAYRNVRELVMSRANQPVTRAEIEAAIDAARPQGVAPPGRCVRLHTARDDDPGPHGAVRFDWGEFFGDEARSYPPPERWKELTRSLDMTRDWIREHARPRLIELTGERRLSAALALGSALSAVAGFTIHVNHRGIIWHTDAHEGADTAVFEPVVKLTDGSGDNDLVVSVGVGRDIGPAVSSFIKGTELENVPHLAMHAPGPIADARHANRAAGVIKRYVGQHVGDRACVHLFFAGPSPLALFLGHRLNATANVQCYEWVQGDEYAPTCRLRTR